ncbi:hypothetical protein HPB51_027721 [Rhipicephalus microplus]|uniref:Uncharacterized protein n=1 Tax=Rhipicephalus microplus TaxID=6941 RepID=A0A9J6CZA5_RHIMP|nr:hypothetical protein HPB51_027721 [Rhipicephalus microplus]
MAACSCCIQRLHSDQVDVSGYLDARVTGYRFDDLPLPSPGHLLARKPSPCKPTSTMSSIVACVLITACVMRLVLHVTDKGTCSAQVCSRFEPEQSHANASQAFATMSRLKRNSEPAFYTTALQAKTKNRRLPYVSLPERLKCSSSCPRLHEWDSFSGSSSSSDRSSSPDLDAPVTSTNAESKDKGGSGNAHGGTASAELRSQAQRTSARVLKQERRPLRLDNGKKSKESSIEPAGLR